MIVKVDEKIKKVSLYRVKVSYRKKKKVIWRWEIKSWWKKKKLLFSRYFEMEEAKKPKYFSFGFFLVKRGKWG